jgi:hypothetical protein
MEPRGIPGSFESSHPEAGSAEPRIIPMARIQSWAGFAATLEVSLGYVPAQREYLAGAA